MEGDGDRVARGLKQTGSRGESLRNADREGFASRRFRQGTQPTTQPPDAAALKETLYPTGTDELQAVQNAGQIAHGHDQHALEDTQTMHRHVLANKVQVVSWCRSGSRPDPLGNLACLLVPLAGCFVARSLGGL